MIYHEECDLCMNSSALSQISVRMRHRIIRFSLELASFCFGNFVKQKGTTSKRIYMYRYSKCILYTCTKKQVHKREM